MENPKSPFNFANYLHEQLSMGKTKAFLEKELVMNKYYLNKHLWLLTWPNDLKAKCLLYPDIFSARILFTTFASRQKYYAKNNFQYLRVEIEKLIQNGAKHKPRKAVNYPKSRAGGSLISQRNRKENLKKIERELALDKKTKEELKLDFKNILYFQQLFKDLIGFHVIVQFSESRKEGEVRILFREEKDLDYLLERMS
ncbi:hypothetical protein [Fluviispira sanaruensis]|uniref:Uncharacterized protein n=1 Tax=Fluviispira sanaruensis TaxID=2493639 RepID=A0A4P2W0P5_FLUSA|nr:hypothetical protein [Fluviispira sanaruensis]BBH54742.1 hypothetical protein JCM31447_32160 [Fluviispira sanaruensis]